MGGVTPQRNPSRLAPYERQASPTIGSAPAPTGVSIGRGPRGLAPAAGPVGGMPDSPAMSPSANSMGPGFYDGDPRTENQRLADMLRDERAQGHINRERAFQNQGEPPAWAGGPLVTTSTGMPPGQTVNSDVKQNSAWYSPPPSANAAVDPRLQYPSAPPPGMVAGRPDVPVSRNTWNQAEADRIMSPGGPMYNPVGYDTGYTGYRPEDSINDNIAARAIPSETDLADIGPFGPGVVAGQGVPAVSAPPPGMLDPVRPAYEPSIEARRAMSERFKAAPVPAKESPFNPTRPGTIVTDKDIDRVLDGLKKGSKYVEKSNSGGRGNRNQNRRGGREDNPLWAYWLREMRA